MGKGIERQPAHLLCRGITQVESDTAMGILMNGNGEEQNRNFDNPL